MCAAPYFGEGCQLVRSEGSVRQLNSGWCGTFEVLSISASSVAECVLAAFVSPEKAAEWLLRVKLFAEVELLAGVLTHNSCQCVLVRVYHLELSPHTSC